MFLLLLCVKDLLSIFLQAINPVMPAAETIFSFAKGVVGVLTIILWSTN